MQVQHRRATLRVRQRYTPQVIHDNSVLESRYFAWSMRIDDLRRPMIDDVQRAVVDMMR